MHTLVTFLGRLQNRDRGYPKVAYIFPDHSRADDISFIGHGIAARMQPDRLVILGTAGSMWDQLMADFPDCELDDNTQLALIEAVDNHAVTEEQLQALGDALARASGPEVLLRIIPNQPSMEATWTILHTLAAATAETKRLTVDITHGFRHLPMVALMTALYRRSLDDRLQLDGLWYAQLPPGASEAEMHDIRGIMSLADWNEAIRHARTTGDLAPVASLLRSTEPELAQELDTASFKEAVHQGQQARSALRRARRILTERELTGPAALFQPLLEEQTAWVEDPRLHLRQAAHAHSALARGDFLRAALFGYEAFITRLIQERRAPNADPNHFDTREAARQQYREQFRHKEKNAEYRAFRTLGQLRNVLAHGNKAQTKEVEAALHNSTTLSNTLQGLLDQLLLSDSIRKS